MLAPRYSLGNAMASNTKTTVDGNANTASLEIFVNGVLETTYSWNGTTVVLSDRPNDTTVTKDDIGVIVSDIGMWLDGVHRYCSVEYAEFEAHSLDVDDKASKHTFKLKFGDVTAIHAIVSKSNPNVEFKARPELTLSPEQFRRFRLVLKAVNAPLGPYFFFNGD
jgi:hypothetical protein